MANHVASRHRGSTPILILAPHVGAGVAATLIEAGVNYLDSSGNCHLSIPPFFVHVQGKSAEKATLAAEGVRGLGFQVLFAYLAEPALLDEPIRTVADVAGVSRQPVLSMRRHLQSEKLILSSSTGSQWHPRRREDALALWLQGYRIGASALGFYYEMSWRHTTDVDLVVAVAVDALPDLASRPGWRRHPKREYEFTSPAGARVDLIPASADLIRTGQLQWLNGSVMSLAGMDLAFRHAVKRDGGVLVVPPAVVRRAMAAAPEAVASGRVERAPNHRTAASNGGGMRCTCGR